MRSSNLNSYQLTLLIILQTACWSIKRGGRAGSRVLCGLQKWNTTEDKIWPSQILFYTSNAYTLWWAKEAFFSEYSTILPCYLSSVPAYQNAHGFFVLFHY